MLAGKCVLHQRRQAYVWRSEAPDRHKGGEHVFSAPCTFMDLELLFFFLSGFCPFPQVERRFLGVSPRLPLRGSVFYCLTQRMFSTGSCPPPAPRRLPLLPLSLTRGFVARGDKDCGLQLKALQLVFNIETFRLFSASLSVIV